LRGEIPLNVGPPAPMHGRHRSLDLMLAPLAVVVFKSEGQVMSIDYAEMAF